MAFVSEITQKQVAVSARTVAEQIARSCLLLDREDFDGWMQSCASDVTYKITAYSPEIGREMTWLEVGRKDLEALFTDLRSQVRVLGPFFRHLGPTIESADTNGEPTFTTSVAMFHTTLQGVTSILAASRYIDQWQFENSTLRLRAREVRMDTRRLEFGIHVIL
jgi:methanesulfonate monooxygenase small subunit